MTDPDDKTLLEFVARFAGWMNLRERPGEWQTGLPPNKTGSDDDADYEVPPDYLHSVDAFIADVWPKLLNEQLRWDWFHFLYEMQGRKETPSCCNADARSRCLALWRALEGRLP